MKILFAVCTLLFAQLCLADELVRTAQQPQVAPMTVTKTIYRDETYMGNYDEEVAYQVDEPYIIETPYQVHESYVDQEDYYVSERVCHPYTEWEERCDGFGKDRQCRRVPVMSERCDTMVVRKSRSVTKHRWVTKVRQETHYRKVTKYRTETKCCREQVRQVPDRQFTADIEVTFPANATLIGNDIEKFNISIQGDEAVATIVVTPTSAIYTYQPKVTRHTLNKFSVDMQLIPTYQPADLGENTISQAHIAVLGKAVTLNFIDMGNVRKVQTDYDLTLFNAQGEEILRTQKSAEGQAEIHWALPIALKDGADIKARLQVRRSGVVISGPVEFTIEKSFKVQIEEIYDAAPYKDEKLVGKFSFSGEGASLVLYFRDQTKNIASVKTSYKLTVRFDSFGSEVTKTFRREDLKVTSDGRIIVSALKDLGFTRSQLNDEVTWGTGIYITNEVTRLGTKFPEGSVKFLKSVVLWTDGN